MRAWMPLALVVTLAGCDGGSTYIPPDTQDTDPPADADGDGFDETVDCDDDDPEVSPGKSEICDEKDNDCDGNIDEGFDNDGDGHWSEADCPFGDDCNDRDGKIYPGATEKPYDGTDQDCDGSDLRDVDEDGYDAEIVGGEDCDDEDAGINPGVVEVPYDDIDQDCSGADLLDFDADGHDSDGYGGDDCDDEDPRINPSRMDWLNDGVDNDCDLRDGDAADMRLARAPAVINGTEGVQELLGQHVLMCDFDDDGLDDLVVAAPLGGAYKGRVGVWLAEYADKWSEDMDMDSADVELAGTTNTFFGYTAACGDFNGDGLDDLVLGAPEIHGSAYDQDFTLFVFYGTPDWTWSVTIARADASFTADFLPDRLGNTLYADDISLGDLDGDGKDELLIELPKSLPWMDRDELWIIPGGDYEDQAAFDDVTNLKKLHLEAATGDFGAGLDARVIPDMNGDSRQDLVVLQPSYQVDPDPGTGDPSFEGRVWFIADPEGSGSFEDAAYGNFLGGTNQYLGSAILAADVDGSGAPDLLVGAGLANTTQTEAGMVYVLTDPAGGLSGIRVIEDLATTTIIGEDEDGRLGMDLFPVPLDIDEDGKDEVMIRKEVYDRAASAREGAIRSEDELHLVAGRHLSAPGVALDEVNLAWWQRENDAAYTGRTMAVGDVDGDGYADFFFGAPRFLTYSTALRRDVETGKVYLYRSTDNPWGYDVGVE